jgi:hypothetical protein
MKLRLLACLALLSFGCGGGAADDDSVADGGAADGASAYAPLIATDWQLAGGQERYWCVDVTLDRDLYIGAFRPIAPQGTHHTVMSVRAGGQPDNPGYPCQAQTEAPNWLFASGIGTPALELPTGVGVHLVAGSQIHLNLHLFNTGEGAISGHSGIEVEEVSAASVEHEAELYLPGPFGFSIPATGQPVSYTGTCTVQHDQTLVAIFPHMHQTGVHFKAELVRDGSVISTLWDSDYQFDSQEFAPLGKLEVEAGDQIKTTCTWQNNTDAPIGFGDSSTQEMCFSILMRYPMLPSEDIIGDLPGCTDEF